MSEIEFTKLSQLKVGQCIRIEADHPKYHYKSVAIRKLVDCGYGVEVILNKKKNEYFNAEFVLKGKSNWVKKVWILDKIDKRIKTKERDE